MEIVITFFSICSELLDWYAPRKKKFIRGNQAPFWNRELSKEVMKRTRLRNKFLKYKTIEYQEEYNKQRNYCVSLLRKTKRSYYENLNERNVTDTKNFWKTVKPYLSNKNISNSKITLVENDTILTEDKKVAKELNDFFSTIVMNLGISRPNDFDPLSENIRDRTIQAIVKYRDHPSIVAIRNKCSRTPYFIFPNVSAEEITKEIRKLDPSKTSHDNDIPTKIIKENADIFSEFICMSVNHSIDNNIFPSTLKLANITPVFKKGSANSKENYRPVSILPNLSKIFERCMFKHMSNYFEEHFLSKYQCGFRKGFSAQHCLMALLEKWKTCVDQKQICGALLTDLSKAFDCLPHDLIIAKLNAYGFSLSSLRLIHDYLSNRKQRTKINLTYSSWEEILFGVPQGSTLGPLLFNIFMCDLFFILEETDIASFADDTTPYAMGNSVDEIRNLLENTSKKLFKWFSDNQMKANPDKCHFLMSSDEDINLMIEDQAISNSKCQKLLGIKIDNKLSFNEHLDEICKKAGQKLNALARLTPFMNIRKRRVLLNTFFISQFSYCPLIWMCHSRKYNNKINGLHERCLRIIYSDKKSTFDELLKQDGSVSIHTRNLQFLAIEMYKVKNDLAPLIVQDLFQVRETRHYNLRSQSYFTQPRIKSVNHGSESLSSLGPKIWELVPLEMREINSLLKFKEKIKKWEPKNCPCRLCKKFIQHVGYI